MIERRTQPFIMDEAKFVTQKTVTVFILLIFAGVCGWVFYQDANPSERSTVLQTIINLTVMAVGYWLGSSKGAADNRDQLNKLIAPTPGSTTATVSTPSNVVVTTTEGVAEAKP